MGDGLAKLRSLGKGRGPEPPGNLPFSFEDFSAWFDEHRQRFLEPARTSAVRALDELLERDLSEQERTRVRVGRSRVKSKLRTWQKLNQKYPDRVNTAADIPDVVDDLVGLRIICTNLSDLRRVVEIIEDLDDFAKDSHPVLACVPGTYKDFLMEPKQSGYRARHINLCTAVSIATERHVVVCEVQIRTLLQDSWGELTHEDTYKPGGPVPELVKQLSRRIADLMATLDDLAQDLREELDRHAEAGLSEQADEDSTKQGEATDRERAESDTNREAAATYLRERIAGLDGPIDLASLAWELQREFGQSVTADWFGAGTFKGLLHDSVPTVNVSTEGPSYVVPAGFSIDDYKQPRRAISVPPSVSALHDADRSFPLVEEGEWEAIYAALAAATRRLQLDGPAHMGTVNELTRAARDSAIGGKTRVSRRHLSYVSRALLFAGKLRPNMDADEIEGEFVRWTLKRADALDLPRDALRELEGWLRATTSE